MINLSQRKDAFKKARVDGKWFAFTGKDFDVRLLLVPYSQKEIYEISKKLKFAKDNLEKLGTVLKSYVIAHIKDWQGVEDVKTEVGPKGNKITKSVPLEYSPELLRDEDYWQVFCSLMVTDEDSEENNAEIALLVKVNKILNTPGDFQDESFLAII